MYTRTALVLATIIVVLSKIGNSASLAAPQYGRHFTAQVGFKTLQAQTLYRVLKLTRSVAVVQRVLASACVYLSTLDRRQQRAPTEGEGVSY